MSPKQWYKYYTYASLAACVSACRFCLPLMVSDGVVCAVRYERRRHPRSAAGVLWDNTLQVSGMLGQEYCCMGWIKAEDARLRYIASPQGQTKVRLLLGCLPADDRSLADVAGCR